MPGSTQLPLWQVLVTTLVVTFSEPVTPFGRGIDVYSPSGKRVSGSAQFRDGALVGSLGDFQPLEDRWRAAAISSPSRIVSRTSRCRSSLRVR